MNTIGEPQSFEINNERLEGLTLAITFIVFVYCFKDFPYFKVALAKLIEVTNQGCAMEEGKEQAVYYKDVVKAAMDELRAPVDKLEMIVDKDLWPMPSYGDLIFEV